MATAYVRPMWSGTITFGLVNIPVKMYSAVKEHEVRFRMLHEKDAQPLKRQWVCSSDGEVVDDEQIIKGYEVQKDEFIEVSQDDLNAIKPESSEIMEVKEFVDLDEIDPAYFDRPYYLGPAGKGGQKAYSLLVEALEKTNKVGLSKVVIRNKEYLVALTPKNGALQMTTLRFADEVVPVENLNLPEAGASKKEVDMAVHIVNALSARFKIDKYQDEYRKRVLQMIEDKKRGKPIKKQKARKVPKGGHVNLFEILKKSVEASKKSTKKR